MNYIVLSTHPRSADFKRVENQDEVAAAAQLRRDAAQTHRNLAFSKLSIVKTDKGGNDLESWVTFRATYSERARDAAPRSKGGRWKDDKESTKVLAQRARFLQDATTGRWLYFGGTLLSPTGLGTYGNEATPAPAAPAAAAPASGA